MIATGTATNSNTREECYIHSSGQQVGSVVKFSLDLYLTKSIHICHDKYGVGKVFIRCIEDFV